MTATLEWLDDFGRMLCPEEEPSEESTRPTWATPGALAQALDPRTVQTPALELIDKALVEVDAEPDGRLIIIMPPQEGKSQRATRRYPTWKLTRDPDCRIVIASAEHNLARRFGRAIRDDIEQHGEALNLYVRRDLSSQAEWQLAGYDGGVFSVGIGGTLVGRPADLAIIDDPIKDRKQADSEEYRKAQWDWWTDVLSTRLSPGASVVLILTRWHEDDLAGRLLKAEDGHRWKVLHIPAQADYDPDAGETDILDRAPDEYLASARGRTTEQWEQIKINAGSRSWNSLYQGRPTKLTGGIFKRTKWKFYDQPLWVERADGSRVVTIYDEMLISWDMTFKDTKGTDKVSGGVWMRRGADAFLLDRVNDRMDFVRTLREFRQLAARWPQAVLKLVEDKANGPAVIAMLGRKIGGIVPEEPSGSKTARATAISPLQEAGNLWLPDPELAPWVADYITEHAEFPFGKHDDDVDMTSQAINRLVLQPLLEDRLVSDSDLDGELDDFTIANY